MGYHIDKVLRFHLRFYQLLGLHGLPLPGDAHPSRQAKLLQLWAGCLLTGFSTITFVCLASDDDYLGHEDAFSCFNDGMKYGFAEMAVLSIYGETLP